MIENFLLPRQTWAARAADAVRGLGVISVVMAAVFYEMTDAGVVAFSMLGVFAPRFLGMRAWADILFAVTMLLAAWSNVFDLYTTIPWWDLVVHFLCTAVLAVAVYLLLAQLRIVPAPHTSECTPHAGIVLVTMAGLALSALWEMIEWFGQAYITAAIYVTYDDTVSDMAVGGLGALCAAFAVSRLSVVRPAAQRTQRFGGSSRGSARDTSRG